MQPFTSLLQIVDLKDSTSGDSMEIQRLKSQLDMEKSKVTELHQYHSGEGGDSSDLGDMLESVTKEKDQVPRQQHSGTVFTMPSTRNPVCYHR